MSPRGKQCVSSPPPKHRRIQTAGREALPFESDLNEGYCLPEPLPAQDA
jgi:hypothetical protein